MPNNNISVVVCVKNEERRIEDCLKCIIANNPSEIIVVDGDSSDDTVKIASQYTDSIIVTKNSNLTRDRQVGINATKSDLIAMVDADHRLDNDSLHELSVDLNKGEYDIVQSQLISYKNNNYWNSAEEDVWNLIHNISGPRKMIGVAPAMYNKKIFSKVQFDDKITKTIDDTDFMYRLSKLKNIKIGIGNTKIKQLHYGSFISYKKKFMWYGVGDGEFCIKHPNRTLSMLYHLIVRYPIIYPLKALVAGKIKVIPFFIFQGYVRLYGLFIGYYFIIMRRVKNIFFELLK
jgi:glycosyltransferase involved in cell wall biosynthesis